MIAGFKEMYTLPHESSAELLNYQAKIGWQLRSKVPLQTTEVVNLVKVEGTLDELRALFLEGAKSEAKKVAKKAGAEVVKSTVKRTKSAWQKFMANPKKQIRFKTGKRKGRLDLKRMAAAYRREQRPKRGRK